MKYGKLKEAAARYNVHFRTILNWAKRGRIKTITTPSGARHYELPNNEASEKKIIGYVRVSSHNQKEHLKSQSEVLLSKYPNAEIVSEIASGLNFKRKKLWYIVEQAIAGNIGTVVVTYKDRLARFGFDFIARIFERFNCKVVVLQQISTSPEQELVEDILAIIHVFSSRLYGLRRYKDEFKSLSNNIRSTSETKAKILDESLS